MQDLSETWTAMDPPTAKYIADKLRQRKGIVKPKSDPLSDWKRRLADAKAEDRWDILCEHPSGTVCQMLQFFAEQLPGGCPRSASSIEAAKQLGEYVRNLNAKWQEEDKNEQSATVDG